MNIECGYWRIVSVTVGRCDVEIEVLVGWENELLDSRGIQPQFRVARTCCRDRKRVKSKRARRVYQYLSVTIVPNQAPQYVSVRCRVIGVIVDSERAVVRRILDVGECHRVDEPRIESDGIVLRNGRGSVNLHGKG